MSDSTTPPKRCPSCGNSFPATPEYFHRNRTESSGLSFECKTCQRARAKAYRDSNKEKIREKNKRYLRENPDKAREFRKRAIDKDPAKYKEKKRLESIKYADKNRIRAAKWYREHPEQAKQARRDWTVRNREKTNERSRARYRQNPEHLREIKRQSALRHPETGRAGVLRRIARLKSAPGTHNGADIKRQYASQKGRCWWCGKKVGDKFQVDHLIPLSRGGSNDARNIVIACPACNRNKSNKFPSEWSDRLL